MSRSTFSGPIKSGTNRYAPYKNTGTTVLSQTLPLAFDTTLVQNATFYIPAGSQILNAWVDVTTGYNSATSATLSIGKTSGGTEYASGVNAKTTGRTTPTFTTTQLTNMLNTPVDVAAANSQQASSAVIATVTSVGQPTAGATQVTIQYIQSDDRNAVGNQ